MKRPVWLFNLDCEQFSFLPITTLGLKSYFVKHGKTAQDTEINIVHFRCHADAARWLTTSWEYSERDRAKQALTTGRRPVVGFSCYTWNMPTFLNMIQHIKKSFPDILVVAGGPHVQDAEYYLHRYEIDVIVLGEGEVTLSELLDCASHLGWKFVPGLAFTNPTGAIEYTSPRKRIADLDILPSALDVVPTHDLNGHQYKWAAYETMRGCPYLCAFCEWGTGAIGMRIAKFSLERVYTDLERIFMSGIEGILFCDSNFGGFFEDIEKAEMLIEFNRRMGRPVHFCTCWTKTHSQRAQRIAGLLHKHRLLEHYTMSLQTITPLALELSNRKNTAKFETVAKSMISDGVPVVSELIWGLPGENLSEFEKNLDKLTAIFPSHTIYPYALLPGTNLYERREEWDIETIYLAPYGKASAEYIVASHTFSREEGIKGYFLITAFILLHRGNIIPLTVRYIAMRKTISISQVLKKVLSAILIPFSEAFPEFDWTNGTTVFEQREFVYRWILRHREKSFNIIRQILIDELDTGDSVSLTDNVNKILHLDKTLCPRRGDPHIIIARFDFQVERILEKLERMQIPDDNLFECKEPQNFSAAHGWDFGDDVVPKYQHLPEGILRGRYAVWP